MYGLERWERGRNSMDQLMGRFLILFVMCFVPFCDLIPLKNRNRFLFVTWCSSS